MSFWQQLVAVIVTPTVVVLAVAWVLRKLMSRAIDRGLERYKNELERGRIEYQTKLSVIHERRAEVIASVYAKLVAAHTALGKFTSPIGFDARPYKERSEDVGKTCIDFVEHYRPIKIHLDRDICAQLDELVDGIIDVPQSHDAQHRTSGATPQDVGYSDEAWR